MKKNVALDRLITSPADAHKLRLAERALHRWHEQECGDSDERASWGIERDETTGKPFRVVHPHARGAKATRYQIRDMEAAAVRRVAKILARYPGVSMYVQGDPRGCALYLLREGDVPAGGDVSAYYSRGVAVF